MNQKLLSIMVLDCWDLLGVNNHVKFSRTRQKYWGFLKLEMLLLDLSREVPSLTVSGADEIGILCPFNWG